MSAAFQFIHGAIFPPWLRTFASLSVFPLWPPWSILDHSDHYPQFRGTRPNTIERSSVSWLFVPAIERGHWRLNITELAHNLLYSLCLTLDRRCALVCSLA